MATEVERKFIVLSESFLKEADKVRRVRNLIQGYPEATGCSLRIQRVRHIWPKKPDEGRITIKSATPGVSRSEFEYPIPAEDATQLLEQFCIRARVWKIRADVEHEGDIWEVDVYEDELTGLMLCELEFRDEEPKLFYKKPPPLWLGPEVSAKPAYYNQNLAQNGWPPDYDLQSADQIRRDALYCLTRLRNWG